MRPGSDNLADAPLHFCVDRRKFSGILRPVISVNSPEFAYFTGEIHLGLQRIQGFGLTMEGTRQDRCRGPKPDMLTQNQFGRQQPLAGARKAAKA